MAESTTDRADAFLQDNLQLPVKHLDSRPVKIEDGHKVSLLKPDMRLDLGGIGMGFAIDQALRVVKKMVFQLQ